MEYQPLVSVVIPTYNAQHYIGQTIQSVLQQSYTNWELLIVDDCSTDSTADVVSAFAARDRRIRLTSLEANSNLPAVPRNRGVSEARGDLIALLDHDDLWFKHKLRRHVLAHKHNQDLAMTHSVLMDFPGKFTSRAILTLPTPHHPMTSATRLRAWNTVTCSSAVVKADALAFLGPFNESPDLRAIEDYELWLRIADQFRIGFIPEVLGLYRVSLVGTYSPAAAAEQLKFLQSKWQIQVSVNGNRRRITKVALGRARAFWHYGVAGPLRTYFNYQPQVF